MTGTIVAVIIIAMAVVYLYRALRRNRGKPCEAARAVSPESQAGETHGIPDDDGDGEDDHL